MSFSDIVGAISGQNNNLPAGSTKANEKDLSVRMMGEFKKISDIGLVPLTTSQGQVIYIKDIANINDTTPYNFHPAHLLKVPDFHVTCCNTFQIFFP